MPCLGYEDISWEREEKFMTAEAQELKEKFGEMLPFMREFDDLDAKIGNYKNKIKQDQKLLKSKDQTGFIVCLIIGVVLVPFFATIMMLLLRIGEVSAAIAGIGIFLGYLIIATLVIICVYALESSGYKNKTKKLNEEIARLQKEIAIMEPRLEKVFDILAERIVVVPENYRYLMAVECMYAYFVNRRADSLKEAINLYEEELYRMRQEQRSEQMVALQRQQNSALNNISASSAINAAANMAQVFQNIGR